jgi:MFS transporter, SP family, galactose:H+ symporter
VRAQTRVADRITLMVVANAILVVAYLLGLSVVLALSGLLRFIVAFNFGYGSLVWAYASESFPARLRTHGGSAMLSSDLFANLIVGVVFLGALGTLSGSSTFANFLCCPSLRSSFVHT